MEHITVLFHEKYNSSWIFKRILFYICSLPWHHRHWALFSANLHLHITRMHALFSNFLLICVNIGTTGFEHHITLLILYENFLIINRDGERYHQYQQKHVNGMFESTYHNDDSWLVLKKIILLKHVLYCSPSYRDLKGLDPWNKGSSFVYHWISFLQYSRQIQLHYHKLAFFF